MKVLLNTQAQKDTANFALQILVACALVAALFVAIWQVALGNLKADSAVVGSIFTMFIVLVNFCFPNSIGAQKAADTISTLATAASAPTTTTTTTSTIKGESDAQPVEPISPSEVGNGKAVDLGGASPSEPTPVEPSPSSVAPADTDVDYAPTGAPAAR